MVNLTKERLALAGFSVAALVLALSASVWLGLSATDGAHPGRQLYVANCGQCHGASLEGQANWNRPGPTGRMPAPPHDASGHTWHHSDKQLARIILDGLAAFAPGYKSDMLPFRGRLTEAQVGLILAYLRDSWPQREREYQQARTAQDP